VERAVELGPASSLHWAWNCPRVVGSMGSSNNRLEQAKHGCSLSWPGSFAAQPGCSPDKRRPATDRCQRNRRTGPTEGALRGTPPASNGQPASRRRATLVPFRFGCAPLSSFSPRVAAFAAQSSRPSSYPGLGGELSVLSNNRIQLASARGAVARRHSWLAPRAPRFARAAALAADPWCSTYARGRVL